MYYISAVYLHLGGKRRQLHQYKCIYWNNDFLQMYVVHSVTKNVFKVIVLYFI